MSAAPGPSTPPFTLSALPAGAFAPLLGLFVRLLGARAATLTLRQGEAVWRGTWPEEFAPQGDLVEGDAGGPALLTFERGDLSGALRFWDPAGANGWAGSDWVGSGWAERGGRTVTSRATGAVLIPWWPAFCKTWSGTPSRRGCKKRTTSLRRWCRPRRWRCTR